jgi:hypothetical protein
MPAKSVVSDSDEAAGDEETNNGPKPVPLPIQPQPAVPFVITNTWVGFEVVDIVENRLIQQYGETWTKGPSEKSRRKHNDILAFINAKVQRTRRTILLSPLENLCKEVFKCLVQMNFQSETAAENALAACEPMQQWPW